MPVNTQLGYLYVIFRKLEMSWAKAYAQERKGEELDWNNFFAALSDESINVRDMSRM